MKSILLFFIKIYQNCISPILPSHCRYTPSCSTYAKEAILTHGTVEGSWLALKRMLRCHPWGKHGYDPVPPVEKNKD